MLDVIEFLLASLWKSFTGFIQRDIKGEEFRTSRDHFAPSQPGWNYYRDESVICHSRAIGEFFLKLLVENSPELEKMSKLDMVKKAAQLYHETHETIKANVDDDAQRGIVNRQVVLLDEGRFISLITLNRMLIRRAHTERAEATAKLAPGKVLT